MKIIYLNTAQRAAQNLVEKYGRDHVYKRPERSGQFSSAACLYWHVAEGGVNDTQERINNGQPGCIVGHILHEEGVSPEAIASLDGKGSIAVCVPGLVERAQVRITPAATTFLQQLQMKQDTGKTWAEALAYATGFVDALESSALELGPDE